MRRYLNILFLLVAFAVAACSVEEKTHAEGESATYTCPMHPQIVQDKPGTCPICFMDLVPVSQTGKENGELVLMESQIKLGNIKTMRVKAGSAGSNAILTGKLVLDETQTDVISSRAAGRIEKLYLKENGQTIKKGQTLYELYSEELLTLQREYLLALRQNQELGKENPRFASFLEAAKKKLLLYGLTEGQIRSLAKTGNVNSRITFVAPASGVVTEVAAAEGQYVAEGSVLYKLGKLGKIWVEAELYPQEVANVKEGDPIQVLVEGFDKEPVAAKVTFISPEFRAGSQVVILRAELPNANEQYLPGMQANVIIDKPKSATLTLPTDAVIRDGNGAHVWVQSGKDTFKAQMVTIGEESADNVAILSGLKENDKVVVSGAYLLYSEFVLKKGTNPMAVHQH
ncbi:efflux RND transporter periplasmic adaptor subunit [Pontibacter sp. BT310]|uniref:Efflux RND transporter periplasmic adaptor subunit n=1 Tax=Pontibacter populi TaxID=890055 RepID=A0ABS6XG32_9BACT|nr:MULTISPECIES: efflux RND transporter periplasmic adaptor subunit [Pontibacter]MBJ6120102.1 efflux RND transporter periplasmic adaptor subunit [Pontibacter sp. BT310]MBR0572535.1 efflux RND transporter periplasmic adaptor subunit [Microvirga sp. STS03]MBW3366955.1 efflux RND transporter periplasmic adaptor subunit [Pontibacter populi]